jgi:hypothetical protein
MKPMTSDDLYRDANSLQYGTEKPSEEAIDNVVGKLNLEYVSLPSPSLLWPGPVQRSSLPD